MPTMNRCGVIIPRIRTRNGNICCIVCADINVWDSFTSMPSWCNRNRDGCRRWLCSWSQLRMWNCSSGGCMVWTESMPPICSNRDRMPAGTVSIMSNMWISTSMVVPIKQFNLFIGCLEYWDYYSFNKRIRNVELRIKITCGDDYYDAECYVFHFDFH